MFSCPLAALCSTLPGSFTSRDEDQPGAMSTLAVGMPLRRERECGPSAINAGSDRRRGVIAACWPIPQAWQLDQGPDCGGVLHIGPLAQSSMTSSHCGSEASPHAHDKRGHGTRHAPPPLAGFKGERHEADEDRVASSRMCRIIPLRSGR